MELALILLLMTLIVAGIGWVVFAGINKIDQATTSPQRPQTQRPQRQHSQPAQPPSTERDS